MLGSMGQHQSSLQSRGLQLPNLTPGLTDSLPNRREPLGSQADSGDTPQAPPHSATASANPKPSASSDGITMEVERKSVRAAIDSFIENCLAGGTGSGTPPPTVHVNEEGAAGSSDVEICDVEPDNSPARKGASQAKANDDSAPSTNSSGDVNQPEQGENRDVESGHDRKENTGEDDISTEQDKGASKMTSAQSEVSSSRGDSARDRISVECRLKPAEMGASRVFTSQANMPAGTIERSNTNGGDDSNSSRISEENSSDGNTTSVRLKTIIDRVLDDSLGTGHDLKCTPREQHILPQLATDEGVNRVPSGSLTAVSDSTINRKDSESGAGSTVKKEVEPVVCFMDHIEKAVERSFSSITQEEERMEKENDLSQPEGRREQESKPLAWLPQRSKANTETSGISGSSDSTISVQDIVDRVISQTEVISKLMTTSSASSVQPDAKPIATASGTFYPGRAQADINSGSSRREASDKDSDHRRGRPRIRSPAPCVDPRDLAAGKDYMNHMQTPMVRFGPAHPGAPGVRPFVAVTSPHGFPSVAPISAVHPAVMAAAAAGLHHPGLHLAHSTASNHSPVSQPPPLLRVSPSSRMDVGVHDKVPHVPSRSCSCSACTMYIAGEREAATGPLLQLPSVSMPGMSPPPSQQVKANMAASHSQQIGQGAYKVAGVPKGAPGNAPHLTPRHGEGHRFYHGLYGAPMGSVPEHKHSSDSRQLDMKRERGDYHRVDPATSWKNGEPLAIPPGMDHPAMVSLVPHDMKPIKHQPLTHVPGASVKPPPDEGPVLDLTVRREAMGAATMLSDEKPLDLSKKPSSSAVEERHPTHSVYTAAVVPVPVMERHGDRVRSGSAHLHKLETSVESYFQKLQNPMHPLVGQASHYAAEASHGRVASAAGIGSVMVAPGSSGPSIPHSLMAPGPQHAYLSSTATQPGASQASTTPPSIESASSGPDMLLSPTGTRRPQLHPIPAPSLATSLGSSHSPHAASPYQSRTGSLLGIAENNLPTHTLIQSQTLSATPVVERPSSQSSSSSVVVSSHTMETMHSHGSRSVSPPGSERRPSISDQRRGSVSKHEPITNILGNNNPTDVLYLICRLCRQTYGSPYGFRKHFRNQHGFEPKAEHTIVQTISATKNARQLSGNPAGCDMDGQSDSVSSHFNRAPAEMVMGGSPDREGAPSVPEQSPFIGDAKSIDCQQSVDAESIGHFGPHKYRRLSNSSLDSRGLGASVNGGSVSEAGRSPAEKREDTKCLECPECGQTFQLNDFGSYKRHCRQHGQVRGMGGNAGAGSAGTFTCIDCQCSFPEAHLLQEHLVRHQTNIASCVCHSCHLRFTSASQLQEHLRSGQCGGVRPQGIPSSSPSSSTVTNSKSSDDTITSSTRPKSNVPDHPSQGISSTTNVQSSSSSAAGLTICGGPSQEPDSKSTPSMSSFSLVVSTPADLEVQRLPADHIVTSASPDSSSDKAAEGNSGAPSSSAVSKSEGGSSKESVDDSAVSKVKEEQDTKTLPKTAGSSEEDKDSGFSERCPSNDSRSESSQASLLESEDPTEMFLYKHKKFGANRKRAGSSDVSEVDHIKVLKKEPAAIAVTHADSSSALDSQKDASVNGADTSMTDADGKSGSSKFQRPDSRSPPSNLRSSTKAAKTEARHHMPPVWDRITRSQAGRNARTTESS